MVKRELRRAQQVRIAFAEVLDKAEQDGIHTAVIRRSDPVAVICPLDWYNRACEALGDPPL